ncbi:MAG: phytoene/squalene synthase family protein [Cytophagaceae bacterium]
MKELFDVVSLRASKMVTNRYSTSFSLGIKLLNPQIRPAIYAVYGFVRIADEIVDSFHEYNKEELLKRFREDTYRALDERISLNPILNAFQSAVHQYQISRQHIDTFLDSMEMDLKRTSYDQSGYEQYIVGSAEVVGLMCLKIFCNGDEEMYQRLEYSAQRLGAAFQKINFLRDIKADYQALGRTYFPKVEMKSFDQQTKSTIEEDIQKDFNDGLEGIKRLPRSARFGVYVAFIYYYSLFRKIKEVPCSQILNKRIRISNKNKIGLLCYSFMRYKLNLL